MRRLLYVRSVTHRWQQVAVGVALPVAGTLVGRLTSATTASAAVYYLVAVVFTAMFAGLFGGLLASFLSFLGMNYFFTPPFGTLRVQKPEDVIALFGFLMVASLVATLLTEALEQRARAERRERETLMLYQLSSGLLSRDRLEQTLGRVPRDLAELFDLSGCELELTNGGSSSAPGNLYRAGGKGRPETMPSSIELRTDTDTYGVIRLFPRAQRVLSWDEEDLVRVFATQVALAVEAARLDENTRVAKNEAEVSRIRAALFSSVTHDLKTPLSSVKAAATSLLEKGVEFDRDRQTDLLLTIVEETDRLNRLISNILQLTRVRAGALAPRKVPTPIEDVILSVLSRLDGLLASKDLKVGVKVRDDVPSVPMDVLQIDQAMSNILENAMRYAPHGTDVEIRAGRWQSWVEVLVADRGRGIGKQDREKIFEEFYSSDGRDGGSSGLGLAIVRAIVEAHGGSTWAEETPGGGATIGFRLPLTAEVPR